MQEETNSLLNEVVVSDTLNTVYKTAQNINLMLSVLTFTIIIIFLYKYLKSCFKKK